MKYEKHIRGCQPEKPMQVDSGWWYSLLDFLLPPRCVLCGRPSDSVCLYAPCKKDLPWTGPHCRQCGLPHGASGDEICGGCLQKPPPFTCTVSPLQYRFPVDRLVQAFKFNRQLAAGRVLSQLLVEYVIEQDISLPDALIPVPLHPWRMFRRGFNQAYELSSYAARALGIPLLSSSLRRGRNTAAQSGLSGKKRRKNVRGAFFWQGRNTPPRHVVLIDDVMTTGTTVAECARVLKYAGARRVDVWLAARAMLSRRH